MNLKRVKSLIAAVIICMLVLTIQPVLSATTSAILDSSTNDPENVMDIGDAGLTNWKEFESKIIEIVKQGNPNVESPVSLDITHSGGTITRIRPDILVKNGSKYKVVDVKTSKVKDLANLPDLSSFATSNQKVIYPLINKIAAGSSTITKVVVKGTVAAQAPLNLTDGTAISLEDGVDFYVNTPANNFANYLKRKMVK